jgi:hypothetical protein
LQSGSVVVHPNIENNNIELKKLSQGQTFGEYGFITGFPRQSSVTTSSYAHLYFISRKDFLETLQNYPQDYEIYCMLRDQALLNQNVVASENPICLVQTCYTCNQLGHMSTNCHFTHYIPEINLSQQVAHSIQYRAKLVFRSRVRNRSESHGRRYGGR